MGNNTRPYNQHEALKAKTTKELEELKVFWGQRLSDSGDVFAKSKDTIAREQLALISVILAERIGRQAR